MEFTKRIKRFSGRVIFKNSQNLRRLLHPYRYVTLSELCNSIGFDLEQQSEWVKPNRNCVISHICTLETIVFPKNCICYVNTPEEAHKAMQKGALAVLYKENIEGVRCLVDEDPFAIYCKMCNFYRKQNQEVSITAVTGSIGKTTTKNMIASVYSAALGGAFYTSANENTPTTVGFALQHIPLHCKRMVQEVSENVPNETSYMAKMLQPRIAVITTIDKSHFEAFNSELGIVKEICSISEGIAENGHIIVMKDGFSWFDLLKGKHVITVSSSDSTADYYAKDIQVVPNGIDFTVVDSIHGKEYPVSLTNIFAVHNVTSALCAFAAGILEGIQPSTIARGIADFRTEGIRQNIVKTGDNITIYADCYNAVAKSVRSAVATCDIIPIQGKRIAVLGDIEECGAISDEIHDEIVDVAFNSNFDVLIPVGEKITSAVNRSTKCRETLSVISCENKSKVEEYLKNNVSKGDLILFKSSNYGGLHTCIYHLWPNTYSQMFEYTDRYEWWKAITSVN